jgi:hypothetical protein
LVATDTVHAKPPSVLERLDCGLGRPPEEPFRVAAGPECDPGEPPLYVGNGCPDVTFPEGKDVAGARQTQR